MSKIPSAIAAAIRHTIEAHEGGYVNDPHDPGGETKYGISKRTYPHLNIRGLTLVEAVEIYWHDWWGRKMPWLREIGNAEVAAKIFDIGINVGQGAVGRIVQEALVWLGEKIAVDGVVGPRTLGALNSVDPGLFLEMFRLASAKRYLRLIALRPQFARYQRGWLKRAMA